MLDPTFWSKVATFTEEAKENEVDSGGIMKGILTFFKDAGADPFWTIGLLQAMAEDGGIHKVAVQTPNPYVPPVTPPPVTPAPVTPTPSPSPAPFKFLPEHRKIIDDKVGLTGRMIGVPDMLEEAMGTPEIQKYMDTLGAQKFQEKMSTPEGRGEMLTMFGNSLGKMSPEQQKEFSSQALNNPAMKPIVDNMTTSLIDQKAKDFAQAPGLLSGAGRFVFGKNQKGLEDVYKDVVGGNYSGAAGKLWDAALANPDIQQWGSAILPAIGTYAASKLMGVDTLPAMALGAGAGFAGHQIQQYGGVQNAWDRIPAVGAPKFMGPVAPVAPTAGAVSAQQAAADTTAHANAIQNSAKSPQ